ncbi:hypothetical protein ACJMK2_011610 [Sinanodonta woodiana]|uniref:CARD domain-containing protein n=1 Tax=Sinanodonta woodiana TaxID=1069815 RepID=A0ABD3V5M2_SINWO
MAKRGVAEGNWPGEQDTTSEKTRKLIDWLMTKSKSLYTKFKEFLEESGQSSITEKLEREERKQNEEIFTVTSYQRVLKNCYSWLVKILVFGDLEDFMIKKDFIDIVKIRDIKEQVTTSEKTKMLIDCLLKMGQSAYEKFKECLEESGQLLIIEILEAEEKQQNDEKFILSITSHQRILQICLPWLVENLDFDRLMDFIMKKDFIDKVKIRDIKEQVTTSDKIRKLIDWLMTKPKSFYKNFKECVKESGQSSITEKLEGEERKQNEEIFTG